MKKSLSFLAFIFLLLTSYKMAGATANYTIESFEAQIVINQDTSLSVTEEIEAVFAAPKHGIFRNIPLTYSAGGKTIRADFDLISVTDERGSPYKYEVSRFGQSVRVKIGDPDKTITGSHTYVISYKIDDVLQRYDEHDELYWNVTGSEWDTEIEKVTARVSSAFARITEVDCFSGRVATQEKFCEKSFSLDEAQFTSTEPLGPGRDLTVVVGLDKQSQLAFPGILERTLNTLADNWGYPVSLLPLAVVFFFWLKRGRDKRFLSENIYYEPEDKSTKTVSAFERKHLPFVYHPIQGITPAQVGTIIDEKVDIHDVVSEIVELARLGFIKIEKIKTKKLIGKKTDYAFTKLEKDKRILKNYQAYLLDELFAKPTTGNNYVLLSDLKNEFYKNLNEFKKKLYQNLAEEKIFAGNPEKVRTKWIVIFIVLLVVTGQLTFVFAFSTFNFGPIILESLTVIPGILLARSIPRRTAWGYSLFRQIGGLRWYLKKGKWRHEINEKNLFIEEILPLAISLEVVKELARDMKELAIEPPNYFVGTTALTFTSDFRGFRKSAASTLVSAPGGKWSGRSSWSGGSGFSGGGFSGGGFGGGGGGSW